MEFSGPVEAALSTDLRGDPYNFCLWDIHTGTQLVVFKGAGSNPLPKCLHIINNNYFLTANDKVIHIWSVFNKKCQDTKLILPARPSTLCVSPCGNYICAGIAEKIYVWQLHSGYLLACADLRYQTVSVLKMDSEGTFLFSGSEDGMVLMWSFADLISVTFKSVDNNHLVSKEPRFTWENHRGQITDICITAGGRCLTSSASDKSINLYDYRKGKLLRVIEMPSPIWSIAVDKNETYFLAGSQDGNIYEIAVSSLSLSLMNQQRNCEISKEPLFTGHKGKVIRLAISLDGTRLVSASVDSSCKIWDIYQRKMLQDIKHQAPLANLETMLVPQSLALTTMSQSQVQPPLSVGILDDGRVRETIKAKADNEFEGANVRASAKTNQSEILQNTGPISSEDLFDKSRTTILYHRNPMGQKKSEWPREIGDKFSPQDIRADKPSNDDANHLKAKIKELYKYAAEKIFKDAANESLGGFIEFNS